MDPLQFHLRFQRGACVDEGFGDGFVAVFEFDVFAYEADGDLVPGVFEPVEECCPLVQIRFRILHRHPQFLQHHLVEALLLHQQRHVINRLRIDALDDGIQAHVAETRHLRPD